MRRRDFLALAGATVVAGTPPAWAQQAKVRRVAMLMAAASYTAPNIVSSYLLGLADFGYVDGKNIAVQFFVSPTVADNPSFAAMAVQSRPDVILVQGSALTEESLKLTSSIPIVFGGAADPLGNGVISSLARPGRNATGTTVSAPDIAGKRVGVLHEVLPSIQRLTILDIPSFVGTHLEAVQAATAAQSRAIEPVIVPFAGAGGADFASQFEPVISSRPQAMYVTANTYFGTNSETLSDLQIRNRIPLLAPDPTTYPRALLGYGPTISTEIRKIGAYVDAIFKGANAGDLPVQQPTTFDLAVNLTAAKALGIVVPGAVLTLATIVRE